MENIVHRSGEYPITQPLGEFLECTDENLVVRCDYEACPHPPCAVCAWHHDARRDTRTLQCVMHSKEKYDILAEPTISKICDDGSTNVPK